MDREKLLQQKIGLVLSGLGNLSKIFAVQTFAAKKLKITPEQFTVLAVLYENDGIYQRQLSAMTLKDRPNISRIVTILENMGYITKVQESNGRKVLKLSVTEAGRKIYEDTLPVILSIWAATAEGISDQELDSFNRVQAKLRKNLLDKVNIQI